VRFIENSPSKLPVPQRDYCWGNYWFVLDGEWPFAATLGRPPGSAKLRSLLGTWKRDALPGDEEDPKVLRR
jgi:hypothetical protein